MTFVTDLPVRTAQAPGKDDKLIKITTDLLYKNKRFVRASETAGKQSGISLPEERLQSREPLGDCKNNSKPPYHSRESLGTKAGSGDAGEAAGESPRRSKDQVPETPEKRPGSRPAEATLNNRVKPVPRAARGHGVKPE